MTQQEYLIKRKLNLVEFAETIRNISKACKNMGVSRQHYYDIKNALKERAKLIGNPRVLVLFKEIHENKAAKTEQANGLG